MPKESEQTSTKSGARSTQRTVIIAVIILIVVIAAFVLTARAQTADGTSEADSTMNLIVDNVDNAGLKMDFKQAGVVNSDTNLANLATELIEEGIFISPDYGKAISTSNSQGSFNVKRWGEEISATPEAKEHLVQEFQGEIAQGDAIYRILISTPSKSASTVAVVSPNGQKKVGLFMKASRISVPTPRPNPPTAGVDAERTLVLTHYLWGEPAERVFGKVHGECGDDACTTCRLVEERGTAGFLAKIATSPKAIIDGTIAGSCCEASVNYTFQTGFTRIAAMGGEITGELGQSASGSMLVKACRM